MATGKFPLRTDAYVAGNTVTITNGICVGYVTGSAKSCRFQVPLSKPITASNLSVTGTISARGDNGTFISDANLTTFTLTITKRGNGLTIYADSDTAYNVTNNTAVAVSVNITITFS